MRGGGSGGDVQRQDVRQDVRLQAPGLGMVAIMYVIESIQGKMILAACCLVPAAWYDCMIDTPINMIAAQDNNYPGLPAGLPAIR